MMELAALFAIALTAIVGWTLCQTWFARFIDSGDRIYFGPAIGVGACAIVAYLAIHSRQVWMIPAFLLVALLGFVRCLSRAGRTSNAAPEARPLAVYTFGLLLCLYGLQLCFYGLFAQVYPGADEVWNVYNQTGVSPPDQMFAWHQGMFADLHRHYPTDAFYGALDFYDRPQLGGYFTLFFFKLFGLPLTEDHYTYPASALRFYHCLWWLLNSSYLLGVAPLFKRLFDQRAAIFAMASTALGAFFFLCNAGGWVKFAAAYPLLLALVLFIDGRGPILQALLCALSYYLHGSVLPFLAGFGALQILSIYYPIVPRPPRAGQVAWFALVGSLLVGAWFVTVRWMGSKQPLFYYYLYDAGLVDAQTRPVSELAASFYGKYSWAGVSLLPLRNLAVSIFPVSFIEYLMGTGSWQTGRGLSGLASAVFATARACLPCVLGLVTAPFVFLGALRALARPHAGKIALCLYLLPSLLMVFVYRKENCLSLHIAFVFHALALLLWVLFLRDAALRYRLLGLAAIALEGILCVLFADDRFVPVHGLHLAQLSQASLPWLGGYLSFILIIFLGTAFQLRRMPLANTGLARVETRYLPAGRKILFGFSIAAALTGLYSLYCLQFYRAG